MRKAIAVALLLILVPAASRAHHGVGSVGAAGLEGPGAPVETSVSTTLPARMFLVYTKLDHADYELKTPERDDEGLYASYWMFGLGYGFTSWLSGYLFVPYYAKVLEDNSYNTAGFADISLIGTFGFKWDRGLKLVPESQSLDDLEDWYFTLYGGLTLPTGDANLADSQGIIDPGMSLGFGKPSFMFGGNFTKMHPYGNANHIKHCPNLARYATFQKRNSRNTVEKHQRQQSRFTFSRKERTMRTYLRWGQISALKFVDNSQKIFIIGRYLIAFISAISYYSFFYFYLFNLNMIPPNLFTIMRTFAWLILFYAIGSYMNHQKVVEVIKTIAFALPASFLESCALFFSLFSRPKSFEVIKK